MITAVNSYSINSRTNNINPSFTSIHKANYFVKWDDGHFYKAPNEIVKKLQRSIIGMLNKDINELNKPKKYTLAPKKEDKATLIKKALVTLFKDNDSDYVITRQNGRSYGMARSFYANNKLEDPDVYIITGSNMNIVENAARPIGKVWQKTNETADRISSDCGISYDKARELVIPKNEAELANTKKDYYEVVMNTIRKILSFNNPKDTEFNAYFVPVKKGKDIVYDLVDAKFTRPQ